MMANLVAKFRQTALIRRLQKWLDQRNSREILLLVLGVLVLTWFVWLMLLNNSLVAAKKSVTLKLSAAQKQAETLHMQLDVINKKIKETGWQEHRQAHNLLNTQLQQMLVEVRNRAARAAPATELVNLISAVVPQQGELVVTSLKKLPQTPWISQDITGVTLPADVKRIKKYGIAITFNGDFADSVAFFDQLAKLRWQPVWGSLDYQVSEWPQASVTADFYVLGKS